MRTRRGKRKATPSSASSSSAASASSPSSGVVDDNSATNDRSTNTMLSGSSTTAAAAAAASTNAPASSSPHPSKKAKTSNALIVSSTSSSSATSKAATLALIQRRDWKPKRTSTLSAPNLHLTGHAGPILDCAYSPVPLDSSSPSSASSSSPSSSSSPASLLLASASFDKRVFLWSTAGGAYRNVGVLAGHENAVLSVDWSRDGSRVFSASADQLGAVFDVEECARVKRLRGHTDVVNSVSASSQGDDLVLTGSNDGTARLFDLRVRDAVRVLPHPAPVTAVALGRDAWHAYTAGVFSDVFAWDFRATKAVYSMVGHQDIVSSIACSNDGRYLLSFGMDNTLRQWDIQAFVAGDESRLVRTFYGARHDVQRTLLKCAWSPDGSRVAAGSADRMLYVWDVESTRILYKLPGHKGSVNAVAFHPEEPVIASGSHDKTLFVGELDSTAE